MPIEVRKSEGASSSSVGWFGFDILGSDGQTISVMRLGSSPSPLDATFVSFMG